MINIYLPKLVKVLAVKTESIDTKLIRFCFKDIKDQKKFDFLAGQFLQIGLAGWGECPISICSSSFYSKKYFELAIRDIGPLTHRLNQLKAGDEVYIRGPFGNGFDLEAIGTKNLILVGGGCGFVPLRPLIVDFMEGRIKSPKLQIFYGCQNEKTMLFKQEYGDWNRQAEFGVILDAPTAKWKGKKGLVTELIKQREISPDSAVVLVGPPIMYRFVVKELLNKKVKPENIWLSLERKMYCGQGVCQHCAIGRYYVCKDGPVFSYAQLKDIPNAI